LLILDNYEQLIKGATLTSELLAACPNLKLIVTSRERLNVKEEWVLPLEGLALPQEARLSLKEAEHFDGIALFIQRAKQAKLNFLASQDDMPHILRICHLVEGSPLGIELATVWVKMIPLAEIAQEIERNLNFLSQPTRNQRERQQSIQGAFEHSWKLLSKKEQEALRRLAVFVGGFRREAAAAVAGTTLPVLASLVDKSLLRALPNGRYDRHPLLYQYTQEKLAAHPKEQSTTQEKHSQYFFKLLEAQCQELWGHRGAEALTVLDEELDNLQQAWNWATTRTQVTELEKAQDFLIYFHRRAKFEEGATLFAKAAASLDENNPEHHDVLGAMLVNEAWLIYQLDLDERAHDLSEQSLRFASSGSKTANATKMKAFNTLGIISRMEGHYEQARDYAKQALTTARQQEDKKRIPVYLTSLARYEEVLGSYEEAEKHYLEAQGLYKDQGNDYELCTCLRSLGILKLSMDDPKEALRFFLEGLELAESNNFRLVIFDILNYLSISYLNLKEYQKAKAASEQALKYIQETHHLSAEAELRTNMGRIESALGNHYQAWKHLKKSLRLFWQSHTIPSVMECLIYLAELAATQNDIIQGCLWWQFALQQTTTEPKMKREAQQFLDEFQLQLSPEQFSDVQQQASQMSLDDVVASILWLDETNQTA
jgi:predicted ATPase